jgi:hypothetical protein
MASKKKRAPKKKAVPGGEALGEPAVARPVAAVEPAQERLTPDDYIEIEITGELKLDDLKKTGRRMARIPIAERVEVSGYFAIHGEAAPRVTDVSLGGVFIETPRPLEVGDPVQLAFLDGASKLRVSGRVRWVTPFGGLGDARAGMGVELVGVSEPERLRIFELLRGHRSTPPIAAAR